MPWGMFFGMIIQLIIVVVVLALALMVMFALAMTVNQSWKGRKK